MHLPPSVALKFLPPLVSEHFSRPCLSHSLDHIVSSIAGTVLVNLLLCKLWSYARDSVLRGLTVRSHPIILACVA
jgi:hypothetical protein